MRKRTLLIIAIVVAVVAGTVTAVLATNNVSSAAQMEKNVSSMMDEIEKQVTVDSTLAISSNPYDYTKNSASYNGLVAMGYTALPSLEARLKSSKGNGLEEYLLCIAIEDIAGCNIRQFSGMEWDTAQAFVTKWDAYLREVPGRVSQILQSGISATLQAAEISRLGAPAVPFVIDGTFDAGTDGIMASTVSAVMRGSLGAESLKTFVDKNRETIDTLRAYVLNR